MKPLIDGQAIDREIAESDPFPECGSAMLYRAQYDPPADHSSERELSRRDMVYRAFAVCTNEQCDTEIEF